MNTKVNEGKLISGKEAKLAWANGENVEFYSDDLDKWFSLNGDVFLSDVFDTRKLRLKPRTILINGIEMPAPFEPKEDESIWVLSDMHERGYMRSKHKNEFGCYFGAWRTEEEIKQVVTALRFVLTGGWHEH